MWEGYTVGSIANTTKSKPLIYTMLCAIEDYEPSFLEVDSIWLLDFDSSVMPGRSLMSNEGSDNVTDLLSTTLAAAQLVEMVKLQGMGQMLIPIKDKHSDWIVTVRQVGASDNRPTLGNGYKSF